MNALAEKKLAFIDLETTGTSASRDRVIEVAVITWDGHVAEPWSTLINPGIDIPPFIERLTGINVGLVSTAASFRAVAEDLAHRLHGHILVAHNARFDYAFLKQEFRRVGIDYRASVICTLKYARCLYPDYPDHKLDTLIARHGLKVDRRHSAMADAQAIFDFWQSVETQFPAFHLEGLHRELLSNSSLPPHIDRARVRAIPDTAGVYFFYGENDVLLYVGKALHLRQRVLSHFAADHSLAKELRISQQIRRIDWTECAGEIDALLTESRLIKELQPIMNRQLRRRRELCAWWLGNDGSMQPRLLYGRDVDLGKCAPLYGLFDNAREAKECLNALAKEAGLCSVTLGLEKGRPGRPCFARQLRRCRGACCGDETLAEHGRRLVEALSRIRIAAWPFYGPAVLAEGDAIHVVDAWCYLGTVGREDEALDLLKYGRREFNRDAYRILVKHAPEMRPLRHAARSSV